MTGMVSRCHVSMQTLKCKYGNGIARYEINKILFMVTYIQTQHT